MLKVSEDTNAIKISAFRVCIYIVKYCSYNATRF